MSSTLWAGCPKSPFYGHSAGLQKEAGGGKEAGQQLPGKAQSHTPRLTTVPPTPPISERGPSQAFFLTCLDVEPKVEKSPISQGTEEVVATLKGGHQNRSRDDLCGKKDFEFLLHILPGILTQDTNSTYLHLASPCAVVQRMGASRYVLRCLSRGQWHKVGTAHCCPLMG